ncbi:hypothetical protein [Bartonella sp. AS69XJJH]|uniref:hypothetical protein n=1 Tax=Bartonella sp. AS69XJJH TaxID=3243508 RepID=UPI0035CFD67D
MQKKFALTNETRVINNHTLYRIKALKDFADVKAGTLGGFIEKEDNLSHDGNCWVANEACVYNNALVSDNATVFNYARVFDNATVCDNAKVFDFASVYDNAKIHDNALVFGYAFVYKHARVFNNAAVCDKAVIRDNAKVYGNAFINWYTRIEDNETINLASQISDDTCVSLPITKKYEFTNETRCVAGHTLHRIKAIRDFSDVKTGDLGGFIENESNLSHDGNCWVYDNATVFWEAVVSDNAKIHDNACINRNAKVYGNAVVNDDAWVFGANAHVYGNAKINDNAIVRGQVYDNAFVCNKANIIFDAKISDNAKIADSAYVRGFVYGNAKILGSARIDWAAHVYDNAVVSDNVYVCYLVKIFGNAIVDGNQKIYDDIGNNNKTINEAA